MGPIRKIYWLWLGLGAAVLGYGVGTGGGPTGYLLLWELETFGAVFPISYAVLSIPLICIPIVWLVKDADRRRRSTPAISEAENAKLWGRRLVVSGLILAAVAALCYWRTTLLPSPDAVPLRIVLDDVAPDAPVAEYRSILVGKAQRAYGLRYDEVLTGRFRISTKFRHNLVPVTRSDWTPAQPVRFLVDGASERGLLLRGQLPGYARMALGRKGLTIAGDVMVLSADRDFGRVFWYVCSALGSIGAFAALTLGLVWKKARTLSGAERARVAPRVLRYLACGMGGSLILLSLVLAARRVVHIARAASAEGVIAGVQTSRSSPVGKYSFYVDYNTPAGRFHRFAHTWTPFPKAVGDRVTVLYEPGAPADPEILAFDDAWAAYAIIFLPGAVIVLLGALI